MIISTSQMKIILFHVIECTAKTASLVLQRGVHCDENVIACPVDCKRYAILEIHVYKYVLVAYELHVNILGRIATSDGRFATMFITKRSY